MSSIKSRKHYVILDMAFSGIWALFYAIAFIFMANSWRQSDEMFSFAKSNIIGAIFFAFLSVFCWVSHMNIKSTVESQVIWRIRTFRSSFVNFRNTIFSWVPLVLHTKGLKQDQIQHFLKDWAMKQWDKMVISIKDIKKTPDTVILLFKEEVSKVVL